VKETEQEAEDEETLYEICCSQKSYAAKWLASFFLLRHSPLWAIPSNTKHILLWVSALRIISVHAFASLMHPRSLVVEVYLKTVPARRKHKFYVTSIGIIPLNFQERCTLYIFYLFTALWVPCTQYYFPRLR